MRAAGLRHARKAALGLLLLVGCGNELQPTGGAPVADTLALRRPLVSFHPDPQVRVASQGEPKMEWLQVEGQPRRAFVCSQACSLTFRVEDFRAGWLEVAVAAGAGPVEFSIRTRFAGREFEPRWRAELGAEESRQIRVPIPDAPGAEIRLVAQVQAGQASAFWLEPTLVGSRAAAAAPSGAPNVVLITSDTTRQDELGVYGGLTRTPEIDRLGAEGVVFEDAYAVAFATNPSHASLMTSSHAATHGVDHNGIILGPTLPTLAEVLGEQGWATAAFVSAVVLTRRAGLSRGFDLYDDSFGLERRGDLTVSLFERWLVAHARRPFFVWIHFYDPHQPYRPPPGRADPYLEGLAPERVERIDAAIEAVRRYDRDGFIEPRAIEREFDAGLLADLERLARARYRGEIAFVDEQVGRVRAALEEQGLLDDTLMVFTADHGENFLDRGTALAYDHTGVRSDVSRIPLVVRTPTGRVRGRSEALVANLDIAPTIAALAGVAVPASWTGRALLTPDGTLVEDSRDYLVVEGSHRREVSVRTREWLYRELREWAREDPRIGVLQGYAPEQAFELYERAVDPDEFRSRYRPDHPQLARLRSWLSAFDQGQHRELAPPQLDPDQLRALEALGYGVTPESNEGPEQPPAGATR